MLAQALIFLTAAALVVPISKRLGFGAVLGYLAAGIAIGPSVSGLIDDVEGILHFAEIGVVFLLFIIGLELQPRRLKVLRKVVFGFGTAQVLATALVLTACASLLGLSLTAALVTGSALCLSSTAFVLQMLAEQKALNQPHGRAAFGILLMQDLAVIPMLALVPMLAGETDTAGMADGWLGVARATVVLAAFVIGGRYLLRPLLRVVAAVGMHEIFTAAALLLVIGSALLMEALGLSMGLGAFLAGVLVADSEYRHELESDIEPFKGLLLGLFFIAVGMSTELGLLFAEPVRIVALTVALMAVKAVVLGALGPLFGLRGRHAVRLGLLLSQGGEFGFVLFTVALGQGVFSVELAAQWTLVVTLSMALTPIVYLIYERVSGARTDTNARPYDDIAQDEDPQVVICGFGRFGQIVARVLNMRSIRFTALEINPSQVDFVKRYGNKIYYGDAARLDILRAARVDKARLLVIAVDDVEAATRIAEIARRHFPRVSVYARARDRQHALRLLRLGAKLVVRDTLGSSLELTTQVLEGLGATSSEARDATELFRRHDAALLERQYAIQDDEQALIQSAKASAQQLRGLFESDAGKD